LVSPLTANSLNAFSTTTSTALLVTFPAAFSTTQ
jgi:hypothetical protein